MPSTKSWKPDRISTALLITLSLASAAVGPALAEGKTISEELAPILSKGYELMQQGDYSPAVKTLAGAVRTDSDSITARRYLAYALVKNGDPKDAIAQLNAIVKKIKPTYFEWCTFGEAYLEAGSVDQAKSCFETALKQSPRCDYARSGLIRANLKNNEIQAALDLAEEGMKSAKDQEIYDYYKGLYRVAYSHKSAIPAPAVQRIQETRTGADTPPARAPKASGGSFDAALDAIRNQRRITNNPGG
ncbi:MAG: tetratricopeptide repeat protein [Candidatus Melainabacteria bacterium]|nr:tetratricopeptide repeat protein [Candidatus Melainabacteria bacterium]